jgi:hypothetical protein
MTLVFRPTGHFWKSRIIVPIICLLAVLVVAPSLFSLDNKGTFLWGRCAIGLIVLSLMFALIFIRNGVLLAFRYVLRVDENAISGRTGGKGEFKVLWSDVMAAWIANTGPYNEPYLFLRTLQDAFSIPLGLFDKDEVWKVVQSYVDPSALEEEAQKKLPEYQEWMSLSENLTKEVQTRTLNVTDRKNTIVIGWVGLIFSLAIAIGVLWESRPVLSLFFIPFIVLSGGILLTSGSVEMDIEGVTRVNHLGKYRIDWNEVRQVETNPDSTHIVLYGENKQLVIPGPNSWSGPDREKMLNWLMVQTSQRQINLKWSQLTEFKLSKNVKVG